MWVFEMIIQTDEKEFTLSSITTYKMSNQMWLIVTECDFSTFPTVNTSERISDWRGSRSKLVSFASTGRIAEFLTSFTIPMMKLIIPTTNAIIRGNIIANGWPQGEPNFKVYMNNIKLNKIVPK